MGKLCEVILKYHFLWEVTYYGGRQDVAHLYPVSDAKAQELVDIIDNSEYDETTTLQIEISQYAWNGASEIDII